jgi:hypothetical protein
MTVEEFIESLPEEKREGMADFLYSRIPCTFGLRDSKELADSLKPSQEPHFSYRSVPPTR